MINSAVGGLNCWYSFSGLPARRVCVGNVLYVSQINCLSSAGTCSQNEGVRNGSMQSSHHLRTFQLLLKHKEEIWHFIITYNMLNIKFYLLYGKLILQLKHIILIWVIYKYSLAIVHAMLDLYIQNCSLFTILYCKYSQDCYC